MHLTRASVPGDDVGKTDDAAERDLRAHTSVRYAGALAALALVLTFAFAHTPLHGPPCLFRSMFGFPCPGCGMTRSMMALWRGDLALSLRYHPLGPLALAAIGGVAAWCAAYAGAPRWRPVLRRASRALARPCAGWSVAALLVGVWALRVADHLMRGGGFPW
jgi:hypothetical protein